MNFLFCRGGQTRTDGLHVPNVARYQLRYTPIFLIKTGLTLTLFKNRVQIYTFFNSY